MAVPAPTLVEDSKFVGREGTPCRVRWSFQIHIIPLVQLERSDFTVIDILHLDISDSIILVQVSWKSAVGRFGQFSRKSSSYPWLRPTNNPKGLLMDFGILFFHIIVMLRSLCCSNFQIKDAAWQLVAATQIHSVPTSTKYARSVAFRFHK